MSEKEKLLKNLVEKSGKTKEEIEKLISDKVNELSGLISDEGAIYIIANELGVRLESEKPTREVELVKISDITEPKTPVSLLCKVLRKYDRVNFSTSSGTEGSVQSVLVGDDTGIIRIVFWNEKTEILENIHENDILRIINAYTRENTNSERIEIHYSQYSDIEVNPQGVEVKVKEMPMNEGISFTEKNINDIEEGEKNIKINGIVTDFDIPRFYVGCPECFKKVFQDDGEYKCAQHGTVEAIKIPIVNMILDDSTGTITIVGFRDRAERLTNSHSDHIISLTENIDKYRDFSKQIIGSKVNVAGNVSLNNMTGEKQLLVNQILEVDIKTIDELAEDIIDDEKNKKEETVKSEDTKVQEEKKETSQEDKKKEKTQVSEDDLDLEIEDIDFDDDL